MREQSAPVIFGCSGLEFSSQEIELFERVRPWGLILFQRNCDNKTQVRILTDHFRKIVGDPAAPVLIDQEGGRVARLKAPVWAEYPAPGVFAALYDLDPEAATAAAFLNARVQAAELLEIGINVNCAPMIDVRDPLAHDIIGDRALGDAPDRVIALGQAIGEGLLAGGVLPVIKHIPGHGRARADSHETLPEVTASADELERDFSPFRALSTFPMAMTAHVVYSAVDPDHAATVSVRVIEQVIRKNIGFGGLLMSDDISNNMKALPGNYAERTAQCLAASCDVALHCNGNIDEMEMVASALTIISPAAGVRMRAAAACRIKPVNILVSEALARRDMLLSNV